MSGEWLMQVDTPRSNVQEEKIFVSVRVRPLNEKEIATNDFSDWECINNNTITFNHSLPERAMFPASYTFDRVFGCQSPSKEVYEEGAKEVALSAVTGINSSIFAYGQTSSGKTYTMSAITEYAVADIYDYIEMHGEREFVLKFSAIEIYNEAVRDLLSSDSAPLRLLDDPEKGTVVEKLTELILSDWNHLLELLSICEAQRKIGETSLNETSSRSHQILRLTIESSAREYLGAGNSSTLVATVNFVDLAGSERASQTSSAGARLKEGCHINRSLLTLGTVIRKLSKGKNGHVPYRDSKLTRILQNSLGGNARTAIICTMSPARSHVEQSRNTLLFASCAKEVSTNAQVNVLMSDKDLVKQLQRELARLENELRTNSGTRDFAALLKEKEILIEQMDKEIKDLTWQRDLAQSRVKNMQQPVGEDEVSRIYEHSTLESSHVDKEIEELTRQRDIAQSWIKNMQQPIGQDRVSRMDKYSPLESSDVTNPVCLDLHPRTYSTTKEFDSPSVLNSNKHCLQLSENAEDNLLLDGSAPKFVGPDPCPGSEETAQRGDSESEDSCKEVRCIEMEESSMNRKTQGDLFLPGPKEKIGNLASKVIMDEDAVSSPKKVYDEVINKLNKFAFSSSRERCNEIMNDDAVSSPKKVYDEVINKLNKFAFSSSQERCNEIMNDDAVSSPKKVYDEAVNKLNKLAFSSSQERCDEIMNDDVVSSPKKGAELSDISVDYTYDALKQKIQSMHKAIGCLISVYSSEQSPSTSEAYMSSSRSLQLNRSRSCKAILTTIPSYLWVKNAEQNANIPPAGFEEEFPGRSESLQRNIYHSKNGANNGNFSRNDSQIYDKSSAKSLNSDESDADDSASILNFPIGVNEEGNLQSQKQLANLVHKTAPKTNEPRDNAKDNGPETPQGVLQPDSNWPFEFERRRRKIIEFWDACNEPLVHRTYFFLLFKGEPSDSVYMEIEFRRLSALKDTYSHGTNIMKGGQSPLPASSMKALNREREMLSKQVLKRFPKKERERLYQRWGIQLKTRRRRVQLVALLWKDTRNMDHIKESAALVAKLVGFMESGQGPKEVLGLKFLPQIMSRGSFSWKHTLSSLS